MTAQEDQSGDSRDNSRSRSIATGPVEDFEWFLAPHEVEISNSVLGTSRKTFLGRVHRSTEVAVKVRPWGTGRPKLTEESFRIFEFWWTHRADGIVPFYGAYVGAGISSFAVFRYHEHGNVLGYCEKNPWASKLRLLRETAVAMAGIHENGIFHGNLKPTKILIDENGRATVCWDPSVLAEQAPKRSDWRTLQFRSPERVKGGPPSKEDDVYAFGVTVYQIFCSGGRLLAGPILRDKRRRPGDVVVDPQAEGTVSPPIFDNENFIRPPELRALAERCWNPDPAARPTFEELVVSLGDILAALPEEGPTDDVGVRRAAASGIALRRSLTTQRRSVSQSTPAPLRSSITRAHSMTISPSNESPPNIPSSGSRVRLDVPPASEELALAGSSKRARSPSRPLGPRSPAFDVRAPDAGRRGTSKSPSRPPSQVELEEERFKAATLRGEADVAARRIRELTSRCEELEKQNTGLEERLAAVTAERDALREALGQVSGRVAAAE